MTASPLLPGATLGVLGGGQLGRMFAQVARRMGYEVAVYTPESGSPAGQVATRTVQADYEDLAALEEFARSIDVLTFEFENVPARAAEVAARHTLVRPGGRLLHTAQHRLREKRALRELGIGVAPFAAIESEADLAPALATVGPDGVLKTAALGYDGKGQRRVEAAADLAPAWDSIERREAVYEGFVPFECEVSVVGARGVDGGVALFPCAHNEHANHILDVSTSPAPVDARVGHQAQEVARAVLEGLEVVGVLCVEMFVLAGGELLVNEIAPRPHNSGHLTIEACAASQFEQQVRAVCGLPLGDPALERPAAMANLLGDLWSRGEPAWSRALAVPGVRLHLYGKSSARTGRKMGHLTATADTAQEARDRVLRARASLQQR